MIMSEGNDALHCKFLVRTVNHEDFDDVKKIKHWIISVIIKKGENVDHALF